MTNIPADAATRALRKRTTSSEGSYVRASGRIPAGVSRQTLAYAPYPVFAERGSGQYLWDVDGNRYLDLVNNYTSLIHGHAHGPTVEATIAELRRGGALGAPCTSEREFADLLTERFPVMERLRFALSGTEAVAFATRAARAFTGRKRLLKFEGGFHGSGDEVQQSIGAQPLPPGAFGPGVPNSAGLLDVPTLVAVYNDRAGVRRAFAEHGSEIAAVVVEPFLGNAGLVTAEPGFLAFLAEHAHRHGALLIVDEIQSMRLDTGGAQRLHGVVPDLVTLGKIMGGGMPLAAFGGREEIMRAFDGFAPAIAQTGTFTAFNVGLAAGLATVRHFGAEEVRALDHAGARVRDGIAKVFTEHGLPVTVNGTGSMFNICLIEGPVRDYRTWRAADDRTWTRVRTGLLARGVHINARGTGCLSTPMTDTDLDDFLTALHLAVGDATKNPEPTP
ncbi:aminotransferase class III-fold pyridoxal phosphate-dependent enzyme [Streptomyces sp. SID3343]|uniref:aspartate aminotransferase family protein n=1 Tax=Streptomyces sp. SID3343 TaxID=2690260 RepID=UPI00136B5FB1|nr:aminotransferase class III-fold pyridoxal phosphate-dependent enzyme [Streptomyces sp. SID3343]MYV99215.1 aminotransferase class III-fold pyridoxal phosphate-dependent enzyme [Streptomyces sp. SID3343]